MGGMEVDSEPHSPTSASKSGGGRQRVISSCLTCRRRKVKCDHVHPVCGACTRGSHICTWSDQTQGQSIGSRISKPALPTTGKIAKNNDVQSRLDRLELLLEKAVAGQKPSAPKPAIPSVDIEKKPHDTQPSPASSSQTSHGAGIAYDDRDGTLLLDGGQSQFVSSLHYALLADEIQDIKAILGEKTQEERKETPQNSLVDLLSLGRAVAGSGLEQLLPNNQATRDVLLEVYHTNVDPMVRITHKPTLIQKFMSYNQETHPFSFAIYFSAINSLPPNVVLDKFGESKESLLDRFQLGVEISLARENYLASPSLELLQAFVLWLTCITREEDISKAWVLLGTAFRIGLSQGLHRDPSLFPSGSMDVVTIELRRRMWHQIGHLDFRSAECKGQEPSITEDFYTTLLPRNIDDEELIDGASPGPSPYDSKKFTTMTFQLVRFHGMRCLRRIIQSTYRLEWRMLNSGLQGKSAPDPAQELHNLYEEIKVMLDRYHEETQDKLLQYCDEKIPMQRLCVRMAALLEWRCYVVFWLRIPRAYRDVVFSANIRRSIFEKSISCIETLNGAAADADAARFHWHVAAVASFQAIMHILTELRNPLFDPPERDRAIKALQIAGVLRQNNTSKAWVVVRSMIDKAVAEHQAYPRRSQSRSTGSFASPNPQVPASLPLETPISTNIRSYPQTGSISNYALQSAMPITGVGPQNMQHQADYLQMMQPMPGPAQVNWDDFNINHINNIAGNVQPTPGIVADLDFGFWGDPFNYENEPAAVPFDATYFPPWNG